MMVEHIAIIGCGAAGATAALQARKFDRKVEISLFNSEKYSQYSRCGLPYTISGKVKAFDDLVLMPPENWAGLNIDAKLGCSVTNIDNKKRELSFADADGEVNQAYDALIFATGARNVDPPIKGLDKKRIYGLRTLDDAKALAKETEKAKNAVIIGGGLVGMEIAEAFHERGLNVTVVEFLPHVLLAMVDSDMAQIIEDHCREHDLTILNNTAAQEIIGASSPTGVIIKNRETEEVSNIPADFVVVATGVRPVTDLAQKIGAEIGQSHGIKTDDRMMTNLKDVYAIGDCAENAEFITRTPMAGGLGTIAVRQARVAGINAAGGNVRFPGIVGAKVTKLFGLEIASTGLTEEMATRLAVPIVKGSIKGSTKPPYYTGGVDLKLKTFFNKDTGKLVGGQLVGVEDAAMRLNVLTLGIQQNIDAGQLFDFENCYAPAVCDTWDPLVQSADVAQKRLKR
jgi:NADH oxidase (H2O2-forming)